MKTDTNMRRMTAIGALALVAAAAYGADAVRDGDFTVEFKDCPKCPYRARFAADGRSATINESRVAEADRPAMVARAMSLMKKAADTSRGGMKRPLMGWSSWNTFGLDISESLILDTARAMATNGLKAAGYTYVNIDDGFFDGHDDKTGALKWELRRFPRGLKPVADGIHALGLKAGTYSDAGIDTCGSMWGGGDKPRGAGSGLYGHDAEDCRLYFNELGFDFIKVDYCGAKRQKLDERARYTEIANAIRATGREVRFNICRWAFPGTWAADIAESWRTTGDIRARWKSLKSIIGENLYLSAYSSPGHYNDMDMLQVGRYVGKIKNAYAKDDTGLTLEEEATHFGMWCMMSSPLLIGCDVRSLPETTRALVTNPYLLTMNQNDLGLQGEVVLREGEAYVMAKDADSLFGTSRFVALYNAKDEPHDFSLDFAAVCLGGKVQALDLGERADLGVFEGAFRATVSPHAAKFIRLDAERRVDREVYEAESAYLSAYQELKDAVKAGTAHPAPDAGASNGMVVRYLGNAAGNDLIWKNVFVSSAGKYELSFSVRGFDGRTFEVSVDGGAPVALSASGGEFSSVAATFRLAAGRHEIRISNANAWAPDVDLMRVKRSE